MIILAITTDDKLVNRLKQAGQIIKCTSVDLTASMIDSGEFDAVVIGDPYTEINTQSFHHNSINIIKNENDLSLFLNKDQDPNPVKQIPKKTRKLVKSEPDIKEVNLKEIGKLLIVTNNINLVMQFLDFDVKVVTTRFSAQNALKIKPRIVLWDLPEPPIDSTGMIVYKWGTDIHSKDDIARSMLNINLRLE